MSHRGWVTVWVALLVCLGFNALWLFRPSMRLVPWEAFVAAVNVVFILIAMAVLVRGVRASRQIASLRRLVQRFELQTDDREREARVLEAITTLSASFLDKAQIRTLLRQVSDSVYRILQVDATIIELLPEAEGAKPTTLSSGANIELGPEVRDEVIGRAKSILRNNIRADARFAPLSSQGLRAMIVAPFKRGQRVIGLIGAFTRSDRYFTGRDLEVLLSFATHTSLLLEGAALIDACHRLSLHTAADQVDDLRHFHALLSAERQLSDREFAVARRIQDEMLPRTFPELANFSFDAVMLPAREVGGDFFDVIPLDGGKWGVAVADVSGKGVPAALVMVMTRTLLRAAAVERPSPRDVLLHVNRELFEQTTSDCFVSIFYGVWDDATRTLHYANAGHEPPILVHDHTSTPLPRGGIALGALGEIENYLHEDVIQLAPDDALLLYTDGVREAMDATNQMYGVERLTAAAMGAVAARQGLVQSLRDDISRFVAQAEQHDDITLLALQPR